MDEEKRLHHLTIVKKVWKNNRLNEKQLRQELIRRWDSERELFNDDIAHT